MVNYTHRTMGLGEEGEHEVHLRAFCRPNDIAHTHTQLHLKSVAAHDASNKKNTVFGVFFILRGKVTFIYLQRIHLEFVVLWEEIDNTEFL